MRYFTAYDIAALAAAIGPGYSRFVVTAGDISVGEDNLVSALNTLVADRSPARLYASTADGERKHLVTWNGRLALRV